MSSKRLYRPAWRDGRAQRTARVQHPVPVAPLPEKARRAYVDDDVTSILRKGLIADGKNTNMGALEALEVIIEIINSNDIMSIEMVLGNESNKQWWPS